MPPPTPSRARALRQAARVLSVAGGERMSRRVGGPVPRYPQEIDAEWLTTALCADAPGARVESVRWMAASAGTTTRASLELAYNDAGAAAGLPGRVFVKCTSSLAQRLMLGLGGFIAGEAEFYNHVRPGLSIEAPAGYFGAVDHRSWRSVVITEDVSHTRGARFWSPGMVTTRTQAQDMLRNAAAWHGALWESPRLAQWRWLRTPADHMRLIDTLIGLANRLPAGARRAREAIPPGLRDRQADVYEGLRRSMQIASRGPRTYLHGDLHVANTYVTGDGAAGVADWQVGLQGSWAYDFAYLVMTALAVEDRRAWERELLEFYLQQLAARGGERVPGERAWDAYRQATFYPYFAWVYTIGRSRVQPRFQPDDVSLTLIERIATAIDDLGSLRAVGL